MEKEAILPTKLSHNDVNVKKWLACKLLRV